MLKYKTICRYIVVLVPLLLFPFALLWAGYSESPSIPGALPDRGSFANAPPIAGGVTFSVELNASGLIAATELDPQLVRSARYGLDFSMGWPSRARSIYQYRAPSRQIALADERLARYVLQEIGDSVLRVGLEQQDATAGFFYGRHWREWPAESRRASWLQAPSIVVLLVIGLLALFLSRRIARR